MRYAKQLEDTIRLQHEAHKQLLELQCARGLVGDRPDILHHIDQILDASIQLFNLENYLDDEALKVRLDPYKYRGWTL